MATKGKKEKKELSDFRNVPFTGEGLFWEDLDKEFLIRLILVWQRSVKELAFNGFIPEITKRYGFEAAMEITERATEQYARVTMPLLAEAAKIKVNNLLEAHQIILLMLDSSARSRKAGKTERDKTIDSHQEIVNENHIKGWTNWCIYADSIFEQVGTQPEIADKLLHQVCAEWDMRLYKFYLEQVLPGKKLDIRLTKVPTLKSRGEKPVCAMECILKE